MSLDNEEFFEQVRLDSVGFGVWTSPVRLEIRAEKRRLETRHENIFVLSSLFLAISGTPFFFFFNSPWAYYACGAVEIISIVVLNRVLKRRLKRDLLILEEKKKDLLLAEEVMYS